MNPVDGCPGEAITLYVDACLRRLGGLDSIEGEPDYHRVFVALTQQQKGAGDLWLDDWVAGAESGADQPSSTPRAFWPGGAPFAVALTHDVDFITSSTPHLYFFRRLQRVLFGQGSRMEGLKFALGSLYRMCTEIPRRERYGDLADWMKLEDDKGVRSTFFFLPYGDGGLHIYDGDYRYEDRIRFDGRQVRISEAIKAIAEAGWEIGLHGSIQSAHLPGLLAQQKRELEEIVQAPVVSVRQHFLSFEPDLTPSLQAGAGFRFDSTHGLNQRWGFPSGTCHAYPLWNAVKKEATAVLEIPMGLMDTARKLPTAIDSDLEGVMEEAFRVMTIVERRGGVLVMNWHPHYWFTGLARIVYSNLVEEGRSRGAFMGPLRVIGEHA